MSNQALTTLFFDFRLVPGHLPYERRRHWNWPPIRMQHFDAAIVQPYRCKEETFKSFTASSGR